MPLHCRESFTLLSLIPMHLPLLADSQGPSTPVADPGSTRPKPDKVTPSSTGMAELLLMHPQSSAAQKLLKIRDGTLPLVDPSREATRMRCSLQQVQARLQRRPSSSAPYLMRLRLLILSSTMSAAHQRCPVSGLGLSEVVWGGLMGDFSGGLDQRKARQTTGDKYFGVAGKQRCGSSSVLSEGLHEGRPKCT